MGRNAPECVVGLAFAAFLRIEAGSVAGIHTATGTRMAGCRSDWSSAGSRTCFHGGGVAAIAATIQCNARRERSNAVAGCVGLLLGVRYRAARCVRQSKCGPDLPNVQLDVHASRSGELPVAGTKTFRRRSFLCGKVSRGLF